MATLCSFRLDNKKLEEFLRHMKPGERSAYLREAVTFYYSYGEILKKILANTETLLQAMATEGVFTGGTAEESPPMVDEKEEMLNALVVNSIDAFLNWGE